MQPHQKAVDAVVLIQAMAIGCLSLYAQTAPPAAISPSVHRIAEVLNISPQVTEILTPESADLLSVPAEAKNSAPAVSRQKAITAVNTAITKAMLDVNRTLAILQQRRSAAQANEVLAEEHAYRRTKLANAFLGTTIGILGSGMQFSSSTNIQHAGDGVSVAGGVVTVIFALCTAGIDEIDSPPNLPPITSGLPSTVVRYLQTTDSGTFSMLQAPPTKTASANLFSCHLHGAPPGPTSLTQQFRDTDILADELSKMTQDLSSLTDAVSKAE